MRIGAWNVLEKLENNEFILLMYLADELPVEDKAEVERMFETDRALREQLAELRGAHSRFSERMTRSDDASPLRTSQAAMSRRIGRAMRQRLADRVVPAPAKKRGLRYPWWAYPSAAVAASVLAGLTWWGNVRGGGPSKLAAAIPTYTTPSDPMATIGLDPSVAQVGELTRTWNLEDPQERVSQAERELVSVSRGSFDSERWPGGGAESND